MEKNEYFIALLSEAVQVESSINSVKRIKDNYYKKHFILIAEVEEEFLYLTNKQKDIKEKINNLTTK